MRIRFESFVSHTSMVFVAMLTIRSVTLAAPADLSGWVGVANTAGANNFTSTATTAGGQFQARFNDEMGTIPSLADDSLASGPLGFDDALSVTGTITFDEPDVDVDPILQLGWYDSSAPFARRLIISPADTGSVGDLRWVIIASGNAGGPIAVLFNNSASSSIPDGTYDFSLTYTPGDGELPGIATATIGDFTASVPMFHTDADVFDRFGYSLSREPDVNIATTYSLQISNINYTGETVSTAVPGDFDGDGDVDGADFVSWQTHFPTATGATLADGDADSNGDVDGADFVVWQTNFPFTPSPAVTSVPEPHSFLMAAISVALMTTWRRHWQKGRSRLSIAHTKRVSLNAF